jgi:hypothetical protein
MNTLKLNPKEPVDKIVERWEKTGLLEGLTTMKKTSCALSLEDLAQLLVKHSNVLNETYGAKRTEDINGALLPIMRRLYDEKIKVIPSAAKLYEDYITEVAGDPEAALCNLYVKDFVNRSNQQV